MPIKNDNRQIMVIDTELAMAVGKKAKKDGFIKGRPHLIAPAIVYFMQQYMRGAYDTSFKDYTATRVQHENMRRYAIPRDIKIKFEDRAYSKGHIKGFTDGKPFMEEIMRRYLDGRLTLKVKEDE